ncbi:division/cell wall cluster transcriptional repressor MraZ, partial [Bacteroidales bacterium OttesenSCG-928-M06]|nr:division/cell wall cluster transcriptional repressor MraZ [Bacteroidales bacterium OttesenSCG-928-M06]
MHNEEHRHFYRQYMKNTELVEMDSSGRILISKKYMQQVFLTKEIRFLGMGDCIEMWNPSLFEKVSMSNEEFKDMARTLLG